MVRAREAAKQDQTRARHRLSKLLLRYGQRPPIGVQPWTRRYLIWVAQLRFTQIAQESTRQDYLHEVEHMRERVARLEQAIMEAVKLASPALQQVINDLQALRGIADISAVTKFPSLPRGQEPASPRRASNLALTYIAIYPCRMRPWRPAICVPTTASFCGRPRLSQPKWNLTD